MAIAPGARLDDYEVLEPLGTGGMGEVWVARDGRLRRRVALKLLPAALTSDSVRVARFEQEARAASALSHPNVCTIHALGQTAAGQHYIAMELVEGQTLRATLGQSPFGIRETLHIATQIAAAVSAAHAAGIVHRDLKPENIMIRPDGFVKVLDFGLAKLTATASDLARADTTHTGLHTDAGAVVGTVAYMSPEQARGEEVDARTDSWSVGVILYEMVAGRNPFASQNTSDVLAAILGRDPAPLARFDPEVPSELQRIVTKALRKERTQRYQTMQDLLLDLEALREELHVRSKSGSTAETASAVHVQARPTPSRLRTLGALWSGVAVLVLGALAAGVWSHLRSRSGWEAATGPPVQRNVTRVTFGSGLQTDAAFSPDGRFIAYASDQAGNFDIWVQPVGGGGEPVQVTKSPAQDTTPDWSPDGSQIVFRSEREGGGLFLVSALGGPERRVASFGVRPKWSPDGSKILFATAPPGAFGGPLFVVSVDGSPPRRVLQRFTDDEHTSFVLGWAWHPDGRRVTLLASLYDRDQALYTMPLEGGPPTVTKIPSSVFRSSVGQNFGEFTWAPGGNAVYFEHIVGDTYIRNLWRLSVDPQTLAAGAFVRLTSGVGQDTHAAISRDGRMLAFTIKSESIRLWTYALDPLTGTISGPGEPLTDATTVPVTASLAPDGRHIAYSISGVGTGKVELWTADLVTNEKRLLTRDNYFRNAPKWSRDGSQLVYQWMRRTANDRFEVSAAVRDVSGADETLLSAPADQRVQPCDWSPDKQSILITWLRPPQRPLLALWPVAAAPHADTAAAIVAEDPKGALWEARYSPNGRWISFVTNPPGRALVCVITSTARRAAVDQRTCLTDPDIWHDKPRWASDGKLLYVWRRDGSLFNVWALPFDEARGTVTGSPRQVTHFDSPAHHIWTNLDDIDPSVSRDRMILPMADANGSIWLLDNADK
jgi:serine/threonine protein kinase/Tol biopolymer transport system component